ncbi:MAG TPA: hypothetical protein VGY32_08315 [Solirubrobacteraceae bacterium]|nr:hypothetical protein [Solirubrobacteraceae bacterium]
MALLALETMVRSKPLTRTVSRRRFAFAARPADRHPAAPEGRRSGGPSQDRALYACGCGYAFNAAVSTSVACPHCGRTQAW